MKSIYIASPAAVATGGPELLHQLCYKLNQFGYQAFLYYYNVPEEYQDRIPEILSTIRDIVTHYETHVKNFGRYRLRIQKEEREFDSCIKKIFPQLCQ